MTLCYNLGLTAGSLMAYVLELTLSPVENHPCGPNLVRVKLTDVYNLTASSDVIANIFITTVMPAVPTNITTGV